MNRLSDLIPRLIMESVDSNITIDDFMKQLESRWVDRDFKSHLQTVEHFYYSDKPGDKEMMEDYFKVLNQVKDHALAIAKKLNIPYVSIPTIKYYLIHQQEFRMNPKEFFPFPLYISASPEEHDTIGIMVDENGKVLEIHEGNDEATPETINLANRLLNPQGKPVRIYGAHGIPVVQQIEMTGYLPKNLYVSKDRGHASGHLDLKGERTMFTGIIDINSVSQESDLDWRVMGPTKIEKFRYL